MKMDDIVDWKGKKYIATKSRSVCDGCSFLDDRLTGACSYFPCFVLENGKSQNIIYKEIAESGNGKGEGE